MNLIPCHTLSTLAQTDPAAFRAKLAALSDADLETQARLFALYANVLGERISEDEALSQFRLAVATHRNTPPDAGRAIARQFHRDRDRFLSVLRALDRDAWIVLAEAYAAYLSRFGAWLAPEHVLCVWAKAVADDITLPHPLRVAADASAESYASW